jgi:hypothetical protein
MALYATRIDKQLCKSGKKQSAQAMQIKLQRRAKCALFGMSMAACFFDAFAHRKE